MLVVRDNNNLSLYQIVALFGQFLPLLQFFFWFSLFSLPFDKKLAFIFQTPEGRPRGVIKDDFLEK